MESNISAIILAAGKGTRIGQRLPKTLYPIVGKPMLYYCLDLVNKIPVNDTYVVVGYKATDVMAAIRNEKINYVMQPEQLGTANAAKLGLAKMPESVEDIIIFNGDDSAFFEPSTIRQFIASHKKTEAFLSFLSAKVENPQGLGRIVRGPDGSLKGVVEEKAATEEQKLINEVNVGCYLFKASWLRENIDQVPKSASGEYYITELISMAGSAVNNFLLKDNSEWRGVNTLEELETANKMMLSKMSKRKEPTVFVFDIDNTILDTESVKKHVSEKLVRENINTDLLDTFWEVYEDSRKKLGFVSIPDFSDAFAERVNDPNLSEVVRRMFYTIPFDRFIFPGVEDLIEYVDPKGEIVIFSEGDLVYQPMKIKNLKISKYLDELFVFENKSKNIGFLKEIYKGRRKIIFDDQLTELANASSNLENSITIHMQQGVYKNLRPESDYKPDHSSKDLEDALSFIKSLY